MPSLQRCTCDASHPILAYLLCSIIWSEGKKQLCWKQGEHIEENSKILNFVASTLISFAAHLYRTKPMPYRDVYLILIDWIQCRKSTFLFAYFDCMWFFPLWFRWWGSKHFNVFLSKHFLFQTVFPSISLISFGYKLCLDSHLSKLETFIYML